MISTIVRKKKKKKCLKIIIIINFALMRAQNGSRGYRVWYGCDK